MRITVVGTGYVGLVTGACFAEMGNTVWCIDKDRKRLSMLKKGIIPFYEPLLDDIVRSSYRGKRLFFTDDYMLPISKSEVIFICVGTPPQEDGSADINYVLESAYQMKRYLRDGTIVAVKSTVPVGTCDEVEKILNEKNGKNIIVVSNPEFLKEGDAVRDFMYPDRVIVGTDNDRAKKIFYELYSPYTKRGQLIIFMSRRSSELTKYAANTYLAMRVSFINEISMLCEKVGADVEEVRKGIGSDRRIGTQFMYPGIGYGGSCFPKDVKALISLGKKYNMNVSFAEACDKVNLLQRRNFLNKIMDRFKNNLSDLVFAVLGVSFKPNTDDIREAPSLYVIEKIIESGGKIRVYDPIALDNFKKNSTVYIKNRKKIYIAKDVYDAAKGSDALLLITEWNEFRRPDYDKLKKIMRRAIIFDGRNIYSKDVLLEKGFEYFGTGT
ncbi:MAG: UDP-glucose/GDP-mannose dehydrogenase family protein [Deltaproteobacteria bacterium]|nr:UDP-glucose/GDP-mannose dehydrogenase family protein [Deltaproteobacteria bacterium]